MRRTRYQAKKEAEESRSVIPVSAEGPEVEFSPPSPEEAKPKTRKRKTRPARKRRKVNRGNENEVEDDIDIDEYEQDAETCMETDVFKFIVTVFDTIQHLSKTAQRRKYLLKMDDFYMKKVDGMEEVWTEANQ